MCMGLMGFQAKGTGIRAMSKQSSNQQQSTNQSRPVELSDQQLDKVAGGITKTVDAASPNLFMACCTGKHFASATVTVR